MRPLTASRQRGRLPSGPAVEPGVSRPSPRRYPSPTYCGRHAASALGSPWTSWSKTATSLVMVVNVAARLEGLAAAAPSGGCAEIHLKLALRRPTQLARFTARAALARP